ncbi:DUF1800 domain-containing protein [Schlegelella sp. ID0723]|uniref:DUF1800 domain-containing protein n=2 Tax=Piscinibacter koreensis TaxID=2742824 RepID=A0A7Y6TXB3_9BURK|nr:DUF1800 domain-containing protein [Schlegelella koreensis]
MRPPRPTAVTRSSAARFLTQATFGPTEADIRSVLELGYAGWIDRQFTLPATSHRAYWDAADATLKAATPPGAANQDQVWESFWNQAVNGPDQLRLRVAFALSEIFVISAVDGNVGNQPRAMAEWLDMLGEKGFTTYRELLETVALRPLMGIYLSWLKNQKADAATGRIPDQNFARESMQLFSIGVVKLDLDGTPVLVDGKPVETYGPDDVAGLSRVYTGFSWACGASNANCFLNGSTGGVSDPDRYIKPMVAYPQYHSLEAKSFLGTTIPASTVPDPAGDLKTALDVLAAHPNTPPFISKQLIQRLVTSNPSPAYVRDVAKVFVDNGRGQRGDLKAVIKAILTHAEALQTSDRGGKLREPVLRLSAYLRAFPHGSDTGRFRVGNTDAVATSLGQTPLRSPSVFNFYRPGYVPPGTATAAAGLVAPEMQLVNETSVAAWVNYMRDNVASGVGATNGTVNGVALNRRDLQRDWSAELALAGAHEQLVASVTDKLLYGTASAELRTLITDAVGKIAIPALNATGSNQTAVNNAKRARVNAALLLTLASPEFLTQK